jgi:hypothetical protein
MHGFFTMVGVLPGCDEALGYVAAAIRDQLGSGGPGHDAVQHVADQFVDEAAAGR